MLQDRNGGVWLADYSEVSKYDPTTKSFHVFPHLPDDPSSCQRGTITFVFEDRAGSIWFSAHSGKGFPLYIRQIHHLNNFP